MSRTFDIPRKKTDAAASIIRLLYMKETTLPAPAERR